MTRAYLIGPMSGIPGFNYPEFIAMAEYFREQGFDAQSPTDLDDPETLAAALASPDGRIDEPVNGHDYEYFIAKSLARILTWKPDILIALDGWEQSSGATKESLVGKALGIPTYASEDYDPILGFDLPERFVSYEDNPERQRQVTGGVKDNASKPRVDLIPFNVLMRVGHVLRFGAKKYKPHNWRLGLRWSDTIASALHHIFDFAEGEDFDPESGCCHIDNAITQLMFLSEYYHTKTGIDDRWSSLSAEERGEAKA